MNEEQRLKLAEFLIDDAHDLLENGEVESSKEVLRLWLNNNPADYSNIDKWLSYLHGVSTDEAQELMLEIQPQFS